MPPGAFCVVIKLVFRVAVLGSVFPVPGSSTTELVFRLVDKGLRTTDPGLRMSLGSRNAILRTAHLTIVVAAPHIVDVVAFPLWLS